MHIEDQVDLITRPRFFGQLPRLLAILSTSSCLAVGCGAPEEDISGSKPPQSVVSTPEAPAPAAPASAEQRTGHTESPEIKPQDEAVQAEVTSFETEVSPQTQPEAQSAGSAVAIAAATVRETISLINLLDLPKLVGERVLQSGPTYLHYSCKGKLSEADSFFQTNLKAVGWSELPNSTPPTDQFIDRLFAKNGFHLRVTLSAGSNVEELGVMLSSLGNTDVRLLPKIKDAEMMFSAMPVNMTYQTSLGIAESAEEIHKLLLEDGWQVWSEFRDNPISVPHYRDLHYRKEACRLLVGIVKNPQNSAEKTSVSYMAEHVTPFDIPMLSDSQSLKLDLYSNRASFPFSASREELVKLLQEHSERFGWTLNDIDSFVAKEKHMVPINVDSGAYLVVRLVESGGKYSVAMESFAQAPKKSSAPEAKELKPAAVADTTGDALKEMHEVVSQEIDSQVSKAIQSEVAKALGSLGNSNENGSMNLGELQAKANELQALFGGKDSSGNSVAEREPENPFDVSEDSTVPTDEYLQREESVCQVTFGEETFELKHVACYVIKEKGVVSKCVMFSDKPIDEDKLRGLLKKNGQPVYGDQVSSGADYVLDFRIKQNSVSLNAKLGSHSLGMSTSKIKSDLLYHQGRLVGRIGITEPTNVRQIPFAFEAFINRSTVAVN